MSDAATFAKYPKLKLSTLTQSDKKSGSVPASAPSSDGAPDPK
jgi:hypothetical protein